MITIKGLIIRETPRGESSKSVTVLSDERGVVDVFVRGGMKSSKTSSPTQLLAYSLRCREEKKDASGQTNYYLNSAENLTMFYHIRLDAAKTALAAYFAELLNYCRIENSDCGDILKLTLNTLYFLDNGQRDPELLKCIFEFRLLCDIGFRPFLLGCSICYAYDGDIMYLNMRSGLLECEKCCINKNGVFSYALDRTMLYIIRYIALSDLSKLFSFRISDRYLKRLSVFTEDFVRFHFKDGFETLRFYRIISQ